MRKQLLRFFPLRLGVLIFGHELCDEEELSLHKFVRFRVTLYHVYFHATTLEAYCSDLDRLLSMLATQLTSIQLGAFLIQLMAGPAMVRPLQSM